MSKGLQVALIGLRSTFGRVAPVLLRQSPAINRLELYDDVDVSGVVPSTTTNCTVRTHLGRDNLYSALKDSDIIIIGDDACTQDLVLVEKIPQILDYTKVMSEVAPNALVVVAASPVNSMVPLIAEALSIVGRMDPNRILGCTTADSAMASTLLAKALSMDPSSVLLPVIGGSSPDTRVPIFSQAKPRLNFNWDKLEKIKVGTKNGEEIITEVKKEPEGIKKAYAAVSFVNSLAAALKGESNVAEIAFYKNELIPGTDYFALPVILGPNGIKKKFGLPRLSPIEENMVEMAVENINIETRAIDRELLEFIRQGKRELMDCSSCPPKCPPRPCCPPPPCIPPKCPPPCPYPKPCYPPPPNPPACEPCPQEPKPCAPEKPAEPEPPCCPPHLPCTPPPPPSYKDRQQCSDCDSSKQKINCPPPHSPPPVCPPPCRPCCPPEKFSCPPPPCPVAPCSREQACPPPSPPCPPPSPPCPPPCCPPPKEDKPKCDSPCHSEENCSEKKVKKKIHFPPPSPLPSCFQPCCPPPKEEEEKKCASLLSKIYASGQKDKSDCEEKKKTKCPPKCCPPQPCCPPPKRKPCCPPPPPSPEPPCCPPPPPPCVKCSSQPTVTMKLSDCCDDGCKAPGCPPPPRPCPACPCPATCPPPPVCTPVPKCPSPGGPRPRCPPPCCPPCNKTPPCSPPPPCCPDPCQSTASRDKEPPFLWLRPEGCPSPPGPPCPPAGPASPCYPQPPCPPPVCPPPTCNKPCKPKSPPPKCPDKPCTPPPPCCTTKVCLPFLDIIKDPGSLSPTMNCYLTGLTDKAINKFVSKRTMSSEICDKEPKKPGMCDDVKVSKDMPCEIICEPPPAPLPRPTHEPAPPLPKLTKESKQKQNIESIIESSISSACQTVTIPVKSETCPEKPLALNLPIIKVGGGPKCPPPIPCTACKNTTNACYNKRPRPKCPPQTEKSYQTLANSSLLFNLNGKNDTFLTNPVPVKSSMLMSVNRNLTKDINLGIMDMHQENIGSLLWRKLKMSNPKQINRGIQSLTAAELRKPFSERYKSKNKRMFGTTPEKTEVSKENIINTFKGLVMRNKIQSNNKKKQEIKLAEEKVETPKKKYAAYASY